MTNSESPSFIQKIKNWPHETKIAALDWAIFGILGLVMFLAYAKTIFLNFQPQEALIFMKIIRLSVVSGIPEFLISGILYLIFKSKFNYRLSVFFHGVVASMTGFLAYAIFGGLMSFDRLYGSAFGLYCSFLYIFLYYALLNLVLLIHERKNRKTDDSSKKELSSNGKTGERSKTIIVVLTFVILAVAFLIIYNIYNTDLTFMEKIDSIIFLVPLVLSLYISYKLLFKKEITSRTLAYLPLSCLMSWLFTLLILILGDIFSLGPSPFEDTTIQAIKYSFALFIAGFLYVFCIWILSKINPFNKSTD
ncbi:hypothetical protein MsAg5_17270 [Methanosarcinaceae archaeon Ag5]|uniref:Uncharacterized protein n=1 Tax=Methanolapillus africanus TaxID=3028297 RepID=A0AAE4MJM0_9EURY|nr:hypothetical protein [Methanosarcinaceae archaeon Ag5]